MQDLTKARCIAMENPYSYFPYDYKMDFYLRQKIETKRKEILEYDSYYKLDMNHIKILI